MAAAKIVSFLGQGFTFLRFPLLREICRDRESHITQRLLDLRRIFEETKLQHSFASNLRAICLIRVVERFLFSNFECNFRQKHQLQAPGAMRLCISFCANLSIFAAFKCAEKN